MPVMNGWEFSKKFEEIISHLGKNITLYIMSSSVDIKDITRAKNIPLVTDYLFKPISTTHITNIYNNLQSDTNQFNCN
jgi:response regulator RpfG family c-di-GMP phosphodiesterase